MSLQIKYPSVYEGVKAGTRDAFDAAVAKMRNHWFGLKDRPSVAWKEYQKGASGDPYEIFPEVKPSAVVSAPVAAQPSVIIKPVTHPLWPKQSECTNFYGQVGTNQVQCKLPFPMRIDWDRKSIVRSYSCHAKVQEYMERVWQRTFDFYGYDKIKELGLDLFGGCLNVRQIRGGSGYSMHSWGIAVDVDPSRNELKTTWKNSQMSKPPYKQFVQFWYDEGAINLGKEKDMDPMHFQFARF